MLAHAVVEQTDARLSHGVALRIILVPEGNGTGVVRLDVNDAADVPATIVHALIIACAFGHLPPAVPVAVPPVFHLRAGLRRVLARVGRARGRAAAERGRVDGDPVALAAKALFKGHFDLAHILEHKGGFHFERLARSHVIKLAVDPRIEGILADIDRGDLQFFAILYGRFGKCPEI